MKFQSDAPLATAIRAYGAGWIVLAGDPAGKRISHNVILSANGVEPWDVVSFDGLNASHFAALAVRKPELVIFGSGARQRFPKPALVRALIEAGIGIETMDTSAACRTWNILMSENRQVLAALLIENERQKVSLE
jgi:uncharacterized protein